MSLRFQKRVKILPGVTLNLSKSGVTTSLGVRGARITVGKGKTRTTVGIPGTGISSTTIETTGEQTTARPTTERSLLVQIFNAIGFVVMLFFSLLAGILTLLSASPKKRRRSRF